MNPVDQKITLLSQLRQATSTLDLLGRNPRITSFDIQGDSDPDNPGLDRMNVPAEGIATPPQMLTAIKDQIQKRIEDITKELGDLGISVDQPAARKK